MAKYPGFESKKPENSQWKKMFGKAIVECSQNTWHDEGIILSKIARIERRFLFTKEETFEGDL